MKKVKGSQYFLNVLCIYIYMCMYVYVCIWFTFKKRVKQLSSKFQLKGIVHLNLKVQHTYLKFVHPSDT